MNAKAYFAQARSLPMQIQAKTKQLQAIRTLQEPLAALPEASKLLSDLAADITAEDAIATAKADPAVADALAGKTVVKEIYVKGRLVNLAVKG